MAYLQKARGTADPIYLAKAGENLQASITFQRNFEALRALAFLAMEKHEFQSALEYASEAHDTVPSDLETKGILSDAYWALGDRSRAMKLVQEMLASGENFAALSRLAVIRFAEGDTAGATESMRNACIQADKESRPLDNRAWCYTRLGTHLAARGDTAAAEEAYRRAVAHIPRVSLRAARTRDTSSRPYVGNGAEVSGCEAELAMSASGAGHNLSCLPRRVIGQSRFGR
jgi:tetratricopeptide (TPR) repeat protein